MDEHYHRKKRHYHARYIHTDDRPYDKVDMTARRSSSRRRESSALRAAYKKKTYGGDTPSRYIENAVVAFEGFGEAQTALKLYEFRDKVRSSEKLRRNVVIKIEAGSVSMTDVLLRRDLWHQKIKHPCKMGCDLVGRVVNVGSKCDNIKVGDRVCAIGLAIGGNAKYAILPASRVFACPEDVSPITVACLARNYMAAYQCLHRAGGAKIRPGNKVLIIGGAGALGQALIQLAVTAGADEVYATGKGSNSTRIIENLGAQALGRKPGEWLPYVKGEMDIVIDSVCSDDYVSSHRALSRSGKLVCVGSTATLKKSYNWNSGLDPKQRFYVVELASSMPKTSFYDVFSSLEMKREVFRKDLFRLFHLCRNNEITPKVAFCITLDEVANAHLDLEVGGVDGTIVCVPFGPEGKKMDVRETGQDQITEYDDGIHLRRSLIGGSLPSMFGKVMKDGTFKVLNKNREEYDDDLYSVAGSVSRPKSRGGVLKRSNSIKRVDSTPFGFQDDMDRSYHRAMHDDEQDDSDSNSRGSAYKSKSRKPSRREDRQPTSSRSRQHSSRGGNRDRRDKQHIESKNRRRGDDDDIRSVRSRHRHDDDDDHSVHSHHSNRSSRSNGSTRSRSKKRPSSIRRGSDDFGIKRTASILRNGKVGTSSRTRGVSSRRSSSNGRHDSQQRDASGRSDSRYLSSQKHSSKRPSRGRSASQPIPRARSRSRDAAINRNARGRPRSRSLDSRAMRRSSSNDSTFSQSTHGTNGTHGTNRSGLSQNSAYSRGSAYSRDDISIAESVVSKQSAHYDQPASKHRSRNNHGKVAMGAKKKVEALQPIVSVKKKGLFHRFRSRSRSKNMQQVAPITAKPKSAMRSSSRPQREEHKEKKDDSKDRHVERQRHGRKERASSSSHRNRPNARKVEATSDKRERDKQRSKQSGRDRNRPSKSDRYDYSNSSSEISGNVSEEDYEEEAVKSVVSLNCASQSISSDEEREVIPREPAHRSNRGRPQSALKNSRPKSALRSSSRQTLSRAPPTRSSSKRGSSRPSSSSRRHAYDDY